MTEKKKTTSRKDVYESRMTLHKLHSEMQQLKAKLEYQQTMILNIGQMVEIIYSGKLAESHQIQHILTEAKAQANLVKETKEDLKEIKDK